MAIAPVLKTGVAKATWGFESLALRGHSTFILLLDTVSVAFIIEGGGRRSVLILREAPDDYRGFRVSGEENAWRRTRSQSARKHGAHGLAALAVSLRCWDVK